MAQHAPKRQKNAMDARLWEGNQALCCLTKLKIPTNVRPKIHLLDDKAKTYADMVFKLSNLKFLVLDA